MERLQRSIANMKSQLPWKTAWVTGASEGIGAAVSRALCASGVLVYGSARRLEQLEQLQAELRAGGGTFVPVPLDIGDAKAISALFQHWDEAGILPELAVLNAGTHDPFPAQEFEAMRCKALLDINLQGTLNCMEPLLGRYLAQSADNADQTPRGHIAVVSSVAGYRGLPTAAAYGASKAALIHLCEALHLDLYGSGVKLQLVNPGFVRTPLTDKNDFNMPALMEPQDAAQRIVRGLLRRKFEICFPRRFVYVLKLLRILPYPWYFHLVRRLTGVAHEPR